MDTAASMSGQRTTAGYAIEIDHALELARRIEAATTSSSTIHLGRPAFLGVAFESGARGAAVAQVLEGTPAATAGIAAGDVITRAGGHKVASPTALQSVLAGYRPGQRITIVWRDAAASSHHATVTLASGPAD
jgi:S1-C subfamily serine protease